MEGLRFSASLTHCDDLASRLPLKVASRDHHFVVLPHGNGPHVVLGPKVFAEWRTHDLSPNDGGGTEVPLAALPPRRTHSRIELHFAENTWRGGGAAACDGQKVDITIEIAQCLIFLGRVLPYTPTYRELSVPNNPLKETVWCEPTMAFIWRIFSKDSGTKPTNSVIQRDVDPTASWDLIGELGDGAFGKVHKVRGPPGEQERSWSSGAFPPAAVGAEQEEQAARGDEDRGDQ